jgi:hypothetical protein
MARQRTWVPWALVTGLLVVSVVAAAVSATTTTRPPAPSAVTSNFPIPSTPFTGFGGYNWPGTPTTVSAQWVVPTIVSATPGVSASTWIAAQGETPNSFVQIGITEQRFTSAPPQYEAFWSDASLRFQAQSIRAVDANDTIAASMTQTPAGWALTIADRTEGWSKAVPTQYEGTGRYDDAQWLQEDPPPSLDTGEDLPYPTTTLVRFTGVKVNGGTPALSYDDAQALSGAGGVYLVPTVFSDDGFSLPPAQGTARQYLVDAARYDHVLAVVEAGAATAPRPFTNARRRREVNQIIGAQETFDSALLHQSWPPSAEPAIRQFVRATSTIVSDYQEVESRGFKVSSALARQLVRDYTQFHQTVEATRARIGLPPT